MGPSNESMDVTPILNIKKATFRSFGKLTAKEKSKQSERKRGGGARALHTLKTRAFL